MAVYFNDLTLDQEPSQNRLLLREFQGVWADFARKAGKRDSRILVNDECLSALWAALDNRGFSNGGRCVPENRELKQFLVTVLSRRYQDPSSEKWAKEAEDRFWGAEFSINIKPSQRSECKAMGWAYVNGSITLGFPSGFFWRNCNHRITETDLEGNEQRHDALCVTERKHLNDTSVIDWLAQRQDPLEIPDPIKTDMRPEDKDVHVRDDHGKDILEDFGRKLNRSPYVTEIINSTEWHPSCDHFILDCRADGIVYVCLHWTDKGLGLAVQTTGRTKGQTEIIAKMLEDEYDHGS